jgi:DNA-binding HxlR family transcriptional regulator
MRRTRLTDAECPISRCLDILGDWWSLLILRDALDGATRFDQFERNLGIAPTMLTRRLHGLVADGLLQRRQYQQRPPRHEYLLTERGRDVQPVIIALGEWGDRHRGREQRSLQLVDRETGAVVEPVLVDRGTGRRLDEIDVGYVAGPAASDALKARFAELAAGPEEAAARRG